jgi:hypothetical protein
MAATFSIERNKFAHSAAFLKPHNRYRKAPVFFTFLNPVLNIVLSHIFENIGITRTLKPETQNIGKMNIDFLRVDLEAIKNNRDWQRGVAGPESFSIRLIDGGY